MKTPHILIVDDEPNLLLVLQSILGKEGYNISTATGGAEALERLTHTPYDLLLLDLHMEPTPGLEVLEFAQAQDPTTVVIILTGHASVESAVGALRLGAFDYLFKPVSPDDLRKRVAEGLQHRQQARQRQKVMAQIETLQETLKNLNAVPRPLAPAMPSVDQRFIRSGQLVIDHHRHVATLDNHRIDLTNTEFSLLSCLVQAAPRVVSPRQLVNQALHYNYSQTEARDLVKWHIHHLRRKIEPDPAHPQYIKTVRYKGYMWRGQPAPAHLAR